MNKNTIKAPCTILLAAVNIIVFLVLSFLGMTEDGEESTTGYFPVCFFTLGMIILSII